MSQRIIETDISQLVTVQDSSLNAALASGVGSGTVYSISKFAINQIVIIGNPGEEGSELILTHAATAPTGNTVTFASNTTKAHAKDTPVYIVLFNQIEVSNAATVAGAKSVLDTSTINPETVINTYVDYSGSSGYYFTRFKNSITSVYSDYSGAIPVTGLASNTVGYAINQALEELSMSIGGNITYDKLFGMTNQMLRFVRGKLKKWSNNQEFDYNVGTLSMGVRRFAMPTTCYDVNSNRSVLAVRAGNDTPLDYIDRAEYLQATEDIAYTEVATEGTVGATSLVLDDTSNLPDSGSVDVYVSGTKYTIEYTDNTKASNTLTVDSSEITVTLPVDSQVWYNVEENDPTYYSIWDGYLYIWPMITSDYEGMNLNMDFYTDISEVDSEEDIIVGPRFDMLVHYLKFKIRAISENGGKEDLKDPSYLQFREILQDAIRNEELGERNGFVPRGNVPYGGRSKQVRR